MNIEKKKKKKKAVKMSKNSNLRQDSVARLPISKVFAFLARMILYRSTDT